MLTFKTPREREEYAQLPQKCPKLFALVVDLAHYVEEMLKKDVVLTSVYRTPDEEAELYKESEHKVIHSAHFTWNAVDLRSSIYTPDEIQGITNYLNSRYKNIDGRPMVIYHRLTGNAFHFHIQLF
jgi:hypothetical protein